MARCWERAGTPWGVRAAALAIRRIVPTLAVAAGVLAAVGIGGPAAPATGHARVSGSSPADGEQVAGPPTEVRLVLDAKPATVEGDPLQVYAPGGRRVDTGGATVSDDARTLTVSLDPAQDLPAGEYQLLYRVVSADTHIISGRITFTVRQARPATSAAPTAVDHGDAAGEGGHPPERAAGADQPPSGVAATAPRLARAAADDVGPRVVAAAAVAGVAVLAAGWRLLRRRSRRRFEAELAAAPVPRRRRPEPPRDRTGSVVGPPSSPAYRPVSAGASGSPLRSPRPARPAGGGPVPARRRPHARPPEGARRRRSSR